jgi:metal-responsive CopG/Arc/MetJ family transcriptional regulator
MKTAVSIPDPVFAAADGLAKKLGITRSRLYARALDAFVAIHQPESLTEKMNIALDNIEIYHDSFVKQAARRVLERSEW